MEPLLETDQAAALISRSGDTLRHWRRTNVGPPWAKIGRRIVYRQSDIERWIEQQFDKSSA